MKEFNEFGPFQPEIPTNIVRNDTRSSQEGSNISVEYPTLGLETDYDLDNDKLVIGVEGIEFSIGPLVQASYKEGNLTDIIVNFNFPHIRETDIDNYMHEKPDEFFKELINKLKTADKDSDIWKNEYYIEDTLPERIEKEINQNGLDSVKFIAAVVLAETFLKGMGIINDDHIEETLNLLYRGGFINDLLSESYLYDDDIGKIIFGALQSLEMRFEDELEGYDSPNIEGVKFSDFSTDGFSWVNVKGENGEVFEERKIEEIGKKNKSVYGILRLQDRLVDVTSTQDRIFLKMRKDGKKFNFSIPLNINEAEARAILKSEDVDPSLIRQVVPFKFQVT